MCQIPAVPQLCGGSAFGVVEEHAGGFQISGEGCDLKTGISQGFSEDDLLSVSRCQSLYSKTNAENLLFHKAAFSDKSADKSCNLLIIGIIISIEKLLFCTAADPAF